MKKKNNLDINWLSPQLRFKILNFIYFQHLEASIYIEKLLYFLLSLHKLMIFICFIFQYC